MMRKCRIKKVEIPSFAKSETLWHKKGFSSFDCMVEYANNAARTSRERAQATQKRKDREARAIEKKAHREAKKRLIDNDRPKQWSLTVKMAQKLGRMLDKGKNCISCDRPDDGSVQFCGSHYKTKGGHPELALDLRNISGACNKRCNLELSGNIHGTKTTKGYIQGIIDRYGKEYLDWLDSHHELQQLDCEQLKAIRKEYAKECRRLEKGLPASRNWRALPSRNH